MTALLLIALGQVKYSHTIAVDADGLRTAKVMAGGKVVWQKPYPNNWVIGGASKDRKAFAFYDGDWKMTIWQAPGKVSTYLATPFPKYSVWADAPCIDELYWSPDKKRIFGIFGSSGGLALGMGTLVVFRVSDRKTYHVDATNVTKAQWTGNRTLKVWRGEFSGKVHKPIVVKVR